MDKAAALDSRLSVQAKGVFAVYLCLESESSEVDEAALADATGLDLLALEALLLELETAGYLATGSAAERLAAEIAGGEQQERPFPSENTGAKLAASTSVVYYLRRADGAVKIGFTKQIRKRLKVLTGQHGPLSVLGTEPGGYHLEAKRHAQFGRLRIHQGQEWFRMGEELQQHLQSIEGPAD